MRLYIAQSERDETVFNSLEGGCQMQVRSCLVVDDSPIVKKIAGRIMRGFGFEVDDAENGQIALEKCEYRLPDVILLDWNMPVMSGIEFLRLLRRMEGGSTPAVIFCTTETDVEHIREAFEAGADEYIMKPFDVEVLRAKLGGMIPV
jgi:two-component system, chemotaxis family, chemotaxis protein CheY